jgi:hypothetical protein
MLIYIYLSCLYRFRLNAAEEELKQNHLEIAKYRSTGALLTGGNVIYFIYNTTKIKLFCTMKLKYQ